MVIILILVFIVIWLFSSIAFDEFIEYQHDKYKKYWVIDGRPRGMFFNPKGSSVISFWSVSLCMTNKLPYWAENDDIAISLYNKLMIWKKISLYYLIAFFPLLILGKNI